MKFGVRDITDVVFKAKSSVKIGSRTFAKGQPVLFIDSATASSLEQAVTTVYAQGGRGNARLIAWEGDKTLTFTVTDALLSPIGFAILSGAGLFKGADGEDEVHVHSHANAYISKAATPANTLEIDLTDALDADEKIDATAPVFICYTETDDSITGEIATGYAVDATGKKLTKTDEATLDTEAGKTVYVDFYVLKKASTVSELQIKADAFGCSFYVEGNTFFRRESDNQDMPVVLTLPNVKIQSNFTFSMAPTGDPSTFDFTMDAFPGYTMFDRKHKVLCVMQMIDEAVSGTDSEESVMPHKTGFEIEESVNDSTTAKGEADEG